jgi:hypothetical protein
MRVLTVPDAATTIINGSMPTSFDDGHTPRFWVLEFIIKVSLTVIDGEGLVVHHATNFSVL